MIGLSNNGLIRDARTWIKHAGGVRYVGLDFDNAIRYQNTLHQTEIEPRLLGPSLDHNPSCLTNKEKMYAVEVHGSVI